MTRTRRMSADAVERILERYGFELVSQKSSHRKWRNIERQLQDRALPQRTRSPDWNPTQHHD